MSNIETHLTIANKVGLHARPARLLVQTAATFQARIQIQCGEKTVSAKSILGVLTLGAMYGDTIKLHAEGEDAEQAITALSELVQQKFNEEE